MTRQEFNDAVNADIRRLMERGAPTLGKSPGQLAYEADLRLEPTYGDGKPRKAWDQLCRIAQWSWERDPTPRAPLDTTEAEG